MRASSLRLVAALLLATPLMMTVAAAAQDRATDTDSTPEVAVQLQRLNVNMERIARLLEMSLQGQQLDLLIQRVEMGSNRLVIAEGNLRSAQATRNSLDDEKLEIQARLDQMAEELDQGTLDMTLEDVDRYTRELDLQLQLLKQRLRDADLEIAELQNEVMRQRESIRDWQDYIDQKLTERQ